MKPRFLFTILLVLCLHTVFADAPDRSDTAISKIVAAAQSFVSTLTDEQRQKVQFEFKDAVQRKRWSNLPTGIFKREGLRTGDLSEPQRKGMWNLLRTALSANGYEKIARIVEADEVLGKNDSAGRLKFGKNEYYLAFLGKPSVSDPWILQFGGHHLGLNVTFVGDLTTIDPSHTGVQPAIYQLEGKTIRPLGQESDKAFALVNSLNDAQRKEAILGVQMRDLVLGPGRDGQVIQPEGVKGSALTEPQRERLLDLASEWIGIQNEAAAKAKMLELKKNVNETWFAWAGPTEKNSAAYFRIQGPTVLIEYAPQRLGGDATKHIHTIYRDPTNEYGARFLKH
jgi:hypothetical protein